MPKSFLDLPVEINLQILQGCGPNDVTCLSLTCKYLYNISEEFRVPHASLSTLDSRLCPKPPKCLNHHPGGRACNGLRKHRRFCHEESRMVYEGQEVPRDKSGLEGDLNDCQTPRWTAHCECFVMTLYKRLESWVPPDLKFCVNCRKFTYRCSKNSRYCGMNARRAAFNLKERESSKGKEEKSGVVEVGGKEISPVTVAETSQMGAAMTYRAMDRMRETWEAMKRERREEMLRKTEEMKRKEEQLRKKEEELKKKEKDLRKREEELWRRKDKIREMEGKIRKREDQVREREEEMGKKGKTNKEERQGSKESKRGFTRCPCKGF